MKIAILPSGQPNQLAMTEGQWAINQAAVGAEKVFRAAGHDVRVFGEYDANGDLVEIHRQVAAMNEWGPDHFMSIHIDATSSTKPAGILILYSHRYPSNLAWGASFGKLAAARVGLSYKGTWNDSPPRVNGPFIIFNGAAAAHGLIIECGNMQSPEQSAWLKKNGVWIGEQEALAFLESLGLPLPEGDDMAIDTVDEATWKPERDKLIKAGIINMPADHPADEAVSNGLLWTIIGRLLDKIEAPPKP